VTTDITCYACANEATSQCPRCGRLYCDDHGEALCGSCLDPASAVPSATVYRGSILALLVAMVLAFWLLVLTPRGSATEIPPELLRSSSTAIAGDVTATDTPAETPTPQSSPGPGGTSTPATGSPTPAGAGTPRPGSPTPAAGAPQQYIVQGGDTLSTIAARFRPANENPADYVARLAQYNGIQPTSTLNIGQVIQIPPQ
jgi:nucleoid-associated protein YgaU